MPSNTISTINLHLSDMMSLYPIWAQYSLVAIIGCCIGSFLNVVIYRKPLIAKAKELEYVHENYGIPTPSTSDVKTKRSHCPDCHTQIPARFNIPVFGWILLRGRTNCCNKPLSLLYPLIELVTGVIFVVAFHLVGSINVTLVALLVMISTLVTICVIDFKHKIIFDLHAATYCISALFTLYFIGNSSEFIIPALIALIAMITAIKGYEFMRNKLMGTNLVMMGDGDWSLWLILFAACASFSEVTATSMLEAISLAIKGTLVLGVLTIGVKAAISKINKGETTCSQEFPAAPAITTSTLCLIFLMLTN